VAWDAWLANRVNQPADFIAGSRRSGLRAPALRRGRRADSGR